MKSLNLKLSLFMFLSAIICTIGYYLLYATPLILFKDILFLCSYIFFFNWVSQLVHSKVRFGVNVTVSILSFALAVYFGTYISLTEYEFLAEYGFYAFYLLTITCIVSVITLIGRIIFSPQTKGTPTEAPQNGEAISAETEHPKIGD